jgi:hypothetical protein
MSLIPWNQSNDIVNFDIDIDDFFDIFPFGMFGYPLIPKVYRTENVRELPGYNTSSDRSKINPGNRRPKGRKADIK